MSDKDALKDMLEDFKCCEEAEADQRRMALADLKFARLSDQWDEEAKNARGKNRPALTFNLLNVFIRQVTNDARMNQASINVLPLGDGASKDTARIYSDLIRNIQNQSSADIVYDTATEFAVSAGMGYFRIDIDYACEDAWDQDIVLRRVANPFSVYGDWESTEATSVDWNRCFVTDWIPKDTFKRRWKDAKAASFTTENQDFKPDWFGDKGVRIAEYWTREEVPIQLVKLTNGEIMTEEELLAPQQMDGMSITLLDMLKAQGVDIKGTRQSRTYKVQKQLVTGTDVLETEPWLGKYIPIVPMYGEEVNINGKRHFKSLHRDAHDSQRAYNYLRTTGIELIGLSPKAPFVGPKGAFATDAAKWESANTTAWPYIEYDQVPGTVGNGRPERQMLDASAAGVLREAMSAHDDVRSTLGLFNPSIGAPSNETSGRAIIARQREGDTGTFHFIDNRNRAIEHAGRIIMDLIPHYYTSERILRCVQDDGESYSVPLGTPVAHKSQLEALMSPSPQGPQGPQQMPEPTGAPQYVPVPPEMQMQLAPPQLAQLAAITKVFDLGSGKYSVSVSAGPSFTTRRQEAAEQMMEFVRVFPQAAGLIGDLLAKNLDWPGADQVAERLKSMLPPQAQGQIPPMVQHLQQMLQQQGAQAHQAVQQLQGELANVQRQLADKAQEQRIKAHEADTDRIEALADAFAKGLHVTVSADGGITGVPLALPTAQPQMNQPMPGQPPGMPM